MFHARGDRVNKLRNRLKFLVRALGFDAVPRARRGGARGGARGGRAAAAVRSGRPAGGRAGRRRTAAPAPPTIGEIVARVTAAPLRGPGEPPAVAPVRDPAPCALAAFRATNVRAQRQPGFSAVTVSLPQGDVTAAQLEVLADLALAHGDGAVRFASDGHVVLRCVPDDEVPALFARLAAAGLGARRRGERRGRRGLPGRGCLPARGDAHARHRAARRGARARAARRPWPDGGAPRARLGLPERLQPAPPRRHRPAGERAQARRPRRAAVLRARGRRRRRRRAPSSGSSRARCRRGASRRRSRGSTELYLAERRAGEAAGPFFARSLDRVKAVLAPARGAAARGRFAGGLRRAGRERRLQPRDPGGRMRGLIRASA